MPQIAAKTKPSWFISSWHASSLRGVMIAKAFIASMASSRGGEVYRPAAKLRQPNVPEGFHDVAHENVGRIALSTFQPSLRRWERNAGAKVIFGTDFSTAAVETANIAAGICKRLNGTLTIMHAAPPAGGTGRSKALEAMLRYRRRNKLKAEAERLSDLGIEVQQEFVQSIPATALAACGSRLRASLILLSSHRRRKAAGSLYGGTAEQLTQSSPAPVLVIRGTKPFEEWLGGKHALNVLVAHDLSSVGDAALAWAAGLRTLGRCKLTVAHFATAQAANDCLEVRTGARRSGLEVRELLRAALTERCRAVLGKARFAVEVNPARRSVSGGLCALAKAHGADLTVVGTTRKSTIRRILLGSVSREVLRRSNGSVAFVPVSRREDL